MCSKIQNNLQPVFESYQGRVLFAYLFGSVAKGETSVLSDIDIAVFISNPDNFTFDDKLMLHSKCCRALKQDDIDLVILNQTKNLILKDQIIRTGVLIWNIDPDKCFDFELQTMNNAMDFKYFRKREIGV